MLRTQDLTLGSGSVTVWNGTDGWGYDLYNGVSYSGTLSAHGTTQTLANIVKNINQSGQRNTYIYRVKYGVNANINTLAGDYLGKVQFGLNLTY